MDALSFFGSQPVVPLVAGDAGRCPQGVGVFLWFQSSVELSQ